MRRFSRWSSRPSSPDRTPSWQRDVRLLAAARGITMAGAEAGYIAVLALSWHITGSASQASLVLLAAVVARALGSPIAGWIGDHVDRRRVIIWADVATGVAFGSLVFADSMAHVLLAMLVGTFASMTGGAALDASLPSLVPANELARANSTLGMARTAGHMVGPVLGGVLVAAVGARGAFLLDGITSFIAAAIVLGIAGSVGGVASRAAQDVTSDEHGRDALAGLRVIARDPVIRLLVLSWCALSVCFACVTAAELPLAVQHGYDELGLALIVTCWCAGSLVGSWLARRVGTGAGVARVLASNAAVLALVFATAGLTPWFSTVLATMAIGGMSMALAEVVESTMLQLRIADAVRARVLASVGGIISAVFGIHLAIAARLVDLWSPGIVYAVGGGVAVVAALLFLVMGRSLAREDRAYTVRVLVPRHALETHLAEHA